MSRFCESDDYYEHFQLVQAGFEANLAKALRSRHGQRVLRELKDALLALPQRRLISGDLADPNGEVCAVGALVAHKRAAAAARPVADVARGLAVSDPLSWDGYRQDDSGEWVRPSRWGSQTRSDAREEHAFDYGYDEYTLAAAGEAGMRRTVAIRLSWLNDEQWGGLSPEQRWERVLRWVEGQLVGVEVSS